MEVFRRFGFRGMRGGLASGSSLLSLVVAVSSVITTGCGWGSKASSFEETSSPAESGAAEQRFLTLSERCESYLTEAIMDRITEADARRLALGPLRKELLSLQNLAGVYSERHKKLEAIQKDSKALEDAIGEYREINEKLAFSKEKGAGKKDI